MNNDAALARQRIASAGSGGGAKPGRTAYEDELFRQQVEGAPGDGGGTAPMNDFTQGFVGGAGGTITNALNKKTY